MAKQKTEATRKTYRKIYGFFDAPVMGVDCGKKCAPINGGEPVCCDVENAVPVMQVSEYKELKSRTKMWRKFKPFDDATQEIVDELADSCTAAECNGARHCERDNRSLACRTFPFFPYMTKDGDVLGLTYYWIFDDRCWVISNMGLVEQPFIDQFLKAYAILFKDDPGEHDVFMEQSATMRRVFSRKKRPIPVITKDREYLHILPKGKGVKRISADKLPVFEPFDEA